MGKCTSHKRWEWACVPLRACVSALLCLGLHLRLRSTLGTTASSLTERRAGSEGRLLPWEISPLRSFRGEFKRGRPVVAPVISDSSGQMQHSASHPLFQRAVPPLASSQRPALVASQRNAPLQQSQWERVAPQPLVTSQREGVAPHQQLLVPPQQLRPVSHQGVPPLISYR
ncbi:hypothetical protein B296_00035530 [Ensete ventricosum]|uniref:Uncharacterized protein n=1 Tax=Ensete ventricosum TaxID=4639 RepID=A0A426XG56_ENSVE|nr:hypothetical protein B296_00035530 [Ensete ventricosum]